MRLALAVMLLVTHASLARAQIFESVGTRAQGMAGAFVAVADDATATWWNPAGLASGAYFSAILERGDTTEPADHPRAGPAWEGDTRAFSIVFPALGLSYYRLRISEIAPTAIEQTGLARQDEGAAAVRLRGVGVTEYGATVGQSLGRHLVLASTLKLVRGGSVTGAHTDGDPLEAAGELEIDRETEPDLDLGAMAALGHLRLAVVAKHVREPSFGDGASRLVLERQVRAGLAVVATTKGHVSGATVAVDADLTRTATAFGEARHVAVGGEAWLFRSRLGFRGGASTNTVGDTSSSTSAGASLAVQSRLYLEGAVTFGSDRARKGWMAGLRVTF